MTQVLPLKSVTALYLVAALVLLSTTCPLVVVQAFTIQPRNYFAESRQLFEMTRSPAIIHAQPQQTAARRSKSTTRLQSAVVVTAQTSKNDTVITPEPSSASTTASEKRTAYSTFNSVLELNQALNVMAEQAGAATSWTDAVSAAVQAENLWKSAEATSDLISFNTVLKAWARTCQTLADLHGRPTTLILNDDAAAAVVVAPPPPPTSVVSSDDTVQQNNNNLTPAKIHVDIGSVHVYTAKDAAMHAGNLLATQLELVQTERKNSKDDSIGNGGVVVPDTASYNSVMDAWSKSRDLSAPDRVQELLSQLLTTSTSSSSSSSKDDGSMPRLQPDSFSYNALVDAYAYSNRPDRIERLHALWDEMRASPTAHPSVRTINSILHAYSKAGLQDPKRAEDFSETVLKIFYEMKETYKRTNNPADQPDVVTYTTLMECLARCGTLSAAEKAEELFTELKEYYRNTSNDRFKPSVYTYTTMIKTWSRTFNVKAPERAEELLEELLQRTDGVKANSIVFTAVIQCWARSRDPNKAVRALKLLQRMKKIAEETGSLAIAPALMSYNSAIDTCARTRGSAEQQTAALKIAFAIFKAIEQQPEQSVVQVNHVTFATLLNCVGLLLPPGDERNKIAQAVFEKAIKASQVDVTVIRSLQKACDASVLQALLAKGLPESKNGQYDYERIPLKWNRNVRT